MPMYRGGNEMLSAYSANTEVCHGYVNGVRVFNCDPGPAPFVAMILTVNATAGQSYMFDLGLNIGFEYNFIVNWGDGSPEDTIVISNDPAQVHQYPALALQYTVTITGLCESLDFGGISNSLLLLDVSQWGYTGLVSGTQMYNDTHNCVFSATDAGGTQDIVTMLLMFVDLDADPHVDDFDVGLCSEFNNFMAGGINANPDTTSWDMRNALTINSMFNGCPSYVGTGVGGWDTAKLQAADSAFKNCPLFNQDISGWNISDLADCDSLMEGTGFSDGNYDLLLIAWAAQAPNVQSTVGFHAGTAQYTTGGAAEAGRDLLTGTYGWNIIDGGPAP